ncbi:MAG: succinate dehydrogenase assembly factor 2 [Alphaproteobacteria bacterium]
MSLNLRVRRALYRSRHRGTRELDIVLGGFAERFLPELDEADLGRFEALLDEPDPELYDWLLHGAAVPERHRSAFMDRLKAHALGMAKT